MFLGDGSGTTTALLLQVLNQRRDGEAWWFHGIRRGYGYVRDAIVGAVVGLVHPRVPSVRNGGLYADYSDALDAIDDRGHVPVPTGPGLGVEIDWDWVRGRQS